MTVQTFIRWARLGVRERLLGLAQARGVESGRTFLDGTNVRAQKPAHRDMLVVEKEPDAVLRALRAYQPPAVTKWIGRDER